MTGSRGFQGIENIDCRDQGIEPRDLSPRVGYGPWTGVKSPSGWTGVSPGIGVKSPGTSVKVQGLGCKDGIRVQESGLKGIGIGVRAQGWDKISGME